MKGPGYETYNSKEVKKERKEEAKTDNETPEDEEVEEAVVPLVTSCKQHFALNFFQCLGVHQQSTNLQFKWILCEQVLPLQQLQGSCL